MELEKLKKLIELAKESKLSKLKYKDKDFEASISIGTSAPMIMEHHGHHSDGYSNSNMADRGASSQSPNKKRGTEKTANAPGHLITSPFVGTFYRSPGPTEAEYVKVGDRVKKGQVLCILEAMKIMNEIESDVSGELVEICVDNENLVEFGQPLFRILT